MKVIKTKRICLANLYDYFTYLGWQAFPSFEVLEPYSIPEDWSIFSNWSYHRQRHPNGNKELLEQLASKFAPLPFDLVTRSEMSFAHKSNSEKGFKEFLYLTQVSKYFMVFDLLLV